MSLSWDASYAIALELRRRHPAVTLEKLTLQEIYDLTLDLPEFDDQPELCNDEILAAILREWYEVTTNDRA